MDKIIEKVANKRRNAIGAQDNGQFHHFAIITYKKLRYNFEYRVQPIYNI